MKLIRLKLKNIRSYESFEIDFPVGSLLLSGDVGSGKTTILLAIEYALFGLQPGQRGSALLRNNSDEGEVSLELEIDDSLVLIERSLKRENKSISNDYAAITINGEKTEYSITELKSRIISLLGYPPEFVKKHNLLYKYTVYTPQEQMKQIILEDSETRLNVLRHIFGIDKYKKIRENLSLLLNHLKEESKIMQGEIRTIESDKNKLETANSRVIVLKSELERSQSVFLEFIKKRKEIEVESKDLVDKLKEKEKFEKEIEKTNILLSSKEEALRTLAREDRELRENLDEIKDIFTQEEYSKIEYQLNSKKSLLDSINTKQIDMVSKIKSLSTAKKELLEKKDRVFKMEFCPTCLQDVPEPHKHNIMNETEKNLVEINRSLSTFQLELTECEELKKREAKELENLQKRKLELDILKSKTFYTERAKKKIVEIEKIKVNLLSDSELLIKHISGLKEQILKFSKFDTLFKTNQESLKKAFFDEKRAEIILAEISKEIELKQKESVILKETINEKEKIGKKISSLSEMSDWLSTHFINLVNFTEMNVMMKLRHEFSRVFSKWFHMIAGESFLVQLDENFTPLVMQGDIEMEYLFLSGGERTAVALAYRLALNQTINSILSQIKTRDIVILDEPTDGFSEAQIEKIREVLEELNITQLVIVSHEQKIEGFVDNIIRLKKDSDSSSIDPSMKSGEIVSKSPDLTKP